MTQLHSDRRRFLKTSAAAFATATLAPLGMRDWLNLQAAELKKQGKSMILLWMAGGPSQMETFDPKPGTENGGPTKAISTSVSGIQVAEGWERTAAVMENFAIIRSMTNKEGNHQRASYQSHTGYVPSGSVKHPSFGSNIAKEIAPKSLELPSVVSISGGGGGNVFGTPGAGFLGVDYAPFNVSDPTELPQNTKHPTGRGRYQRRLGLLDRLEGEFATRGGETVVNNHRRIYQKASKMILSSDLDAFDISQESAAVRESYGQSQFGSACLQARRLVERGVSFVEVQSGGWDTHFEVFDRVNGLAAQVDPGMAGLVADLKERGMLDDTVVVWMGEFGRTPKINPRTGRDHYPRVYNALVAGGGIKGGQVIGSSTKDGSAVAENPVSIGDLQASLCRCLNVDPDTENISPLGRPMRIVDEGTVVEQLFS